MPADVKFIGADEAMADLRQWADQLPHAVAAASAPFAQRVADIVVGRVPRLSGQLAGSVASFADDEGASVGYDGSVPYDGWIEFGGSRGRPYVPEGRYVYPTALDAQEEFATIAADAASESIERFSWSKSQ